LYVVPSFSLGYRKELGVAFVLEEQVRRYQDLVKRAADLRSYL
jgi:hypothetical protein